MPRVPRLLWSAAVAALLAAALIVTARRAADAPATSDMAVVESYTLLASHSELEVGAYSRFQWHHPGPLYFYLLAPWYAIGGHTSAALSAGASALSLASVALLLSILLRRNPSLAVTGSLFLALYSVRASEAMISAWNPHVPLLVTAALVVTAADLLAGNAPLLPIVALLASLAGQAHVALLPCGVVIGGVAFARGVAGMFSDGHRKAWQASVAATLVVLTAAWALPVHQQFTGVPRGNLSELWDFFVRQPRGRQPVAAAVSAWSNMLAGVIRPDFRVARGVPFVVSPVRWAEWLAILQILAVAASGARGLRERRSFDWWLGVLLTSASCISLWSATHIEERIFDHDVYWIAAVGILNLAVITATAGDCFLRCVELRRGQPAAAHDVPGSTIVVVIMSLVILGSVFLQLKDRVDLSRSPPPDAQRARALAIDLGTYLRDHHLSRPLIEIDQDAWEATAGAILDLQKRGTIVSVEDDWAVMFTPVFRRTGREDTVITVAAPAEHLRLRDRGLPLISSHEPVYAHVSVLGPPVPPAR
jgi:hypothetical protein